MSEATAPTSPLGFPVGRVHYAPKKPPKRINLPTSPKLVHYLDRVQIRNIFHTYVHMNIIICIFEKQLRNQQNEHAMKNKKSIELYSFSIRIAGTDFKSVSQKWCKYPERTKEYAHILEMLENGEQVDAIRWAVVTPKF